MEKKNKHVGKGDTINMMINILIVVVILAVLALGAWAVIPKVTQNLQERAQTEQNNTAQNDVQQPQQTVTVAQQAETEGISVDEYKAKYGLGDTVTGETSFDEALSSMSFKNFAAAQNTTTQALREQYKIPDSVSEDTPWGEAQQSASAKAMFGGDEQFAQIKEQYQLTDISDDITVGELLPMLVAAQEQAQASSEPQATDGGAGASAAPAE